jgi:NAD(P)-dependent dehydrogenase (short-subunit alcohol dehydrogenase family)
MDMPTALVTGASRGVGRGAAIGLAESGFKVFATGRTIANADLPDTITRVPCDHLQDDETAKAFARVGGRLDVLVNSSWGGYERMMEDGKFTWAVPFWEQPLHRWSSMMDAGVRAAFVAAAYAARIMLAQKDVQQKRGLIVNISHWAAQKRIGNSIYGIAKAATDEMTADLAQELRPHGVAVVSIYPGLVRTELVMAAAESGFFDLSNSESPEFAGHVIAALARDPQLMERSGSVCVAAALAMEYGVSDIGGRQPTPLTLDTA